MELLKALEIYNNEILETYGVTETSLFASMDLAVWEARGVSTPAEMHEFEDKRWNFSDAYKECHGHRPRFSCDTLAEYRSHWDDFNEEADRQEASEQAFAELEEVRLSRDLEDEWYERTRLEDSLRAKGVADPEAEAMAIITQGYFLAWTPPAMPSNGIRLVA